MEAEVKNLKGWVNRVEETNEKHHDQIKKSVGRVTWIGVSILIGVIGTLVGVIVK